MAAQAPPLARRSTRSPRESRDGGFGSSARAEIDRREGGVRRARDRLLRSRGDRPPSRADVEAKRAAPPLARRSTLPADERVEAVVGSSARAEIDPGRPCHHGADARLLRSRGDRPVRIAHRVLDLAAPPLARRSTERGAPNRRARAGSSARAEIDPTGSAPRRARGGLLRSRGDRPRGSTFAIWQARAPPLARRSTLSRTGAASPALGSSARAEIDRTRSRRAATASWLLRSRGDRPRRRTGG